MHPWSQGESGVDQLVEIIKVLGTPTREEIFSMNPTYTEFRFPQIKAHPWSKVPPATSFARRPRACPMPQRSAAPLARTLCLSLES